jgi:hypothetical protein
LNASFTFIAKYCQGINQTQKAKYSMRKYISIVESLNEATPVKPVQPVKPMKPGDPRHTAQNTTAVNAPTPGSMEHRQQQQAAQAQQDEPKAPDHKLPNGRPNQPLPNGQKDANGQKNLSNSSRPQDEIDQAETDENGDPLDPDVEAGIADGERAAQYLKKQGVIESANEIIQNLDHQKAKTDPTPNNPVSYKGRFFNGGYADIHTGEILILRTFNDLIKVSNAPANIEDAVIDGDAFWFYFTSDGTFQATMSGGPFLARKLERLIRAQLDR